MAIGTLQSERWKNGGEACWLQEQSLVVRKLAAMFWHGGSERRVNQVPRLTRVHVLLRGRQSQDTR
jgi:hypothetical protein